MRFLFLFIVILASALFLFGSAQDVLATHSSTPHCKDITGGWKNVNFPCAIQFGDAGGAQLGTCEYRVVGSTTPSYTQVSCSGSGPVYKDITINVGSSGPCDVQGLDSCNLQLHATDNSGNDIQNNTYFYDIEYTKPTVSANNQSSQWFTSRQTTLSVSDVGGSNLVEKRWSWNTDVGVLCNTGGTTFENGAVLSVPVGSNRLYLCAVDGAGNQQRWDSLANQYRVDNIAPNFTAFNINGTSCENDSCPKTITAQSALTFAFNAPDAGGSGLNRYELWRTRDAAENPNGQWDWQNIQPNISPTATSTTDTPPSNGTWWYGMHAVDNATGDSTGNCITEAGAHICGGVGSDVYDNSPLGPRVVRGPMRVIYGDQEFPTISKFEVSPRPSSWVNSANPNVSVSWKVADTGGSYLKEVTILRCDKPTVSACGGSDWKIIKTTAAPPNSNSWEGSLSPQDIPPEGKSWYGMHVWDNAGHKTVEPSPGPLDVQIDKTPPNPPTTLSSPPPGGTVSIAKPTFDWNDAVDAGGSGVASYHLMADNNQQFNNAEINRSGITTSSFASDVDLNEGTNYWKVAARDVAGNPEGSFSSTQNFQVQLNKSPTVSSANDSPDPIKSNAVLTFQVNWSDPGDQTRIHICKTDAVSGQACSGGSWCDTVSLSSTSPSSCTYTTADQGTKNYYAFACDSSNVCSSSASGTFLVDATVPTIDSFLTVPGPTSWVKISSPNVIIKWDVYDSGTGTLNRIEIWRARDNSGDQILQQGEWDSSALFTKTSGFDGPSADIDQYTDTTLPIEERIYWYGIHVVDNAGNTTVENAPAKVRVDRIAPGSPTLVSPINNTVVTTAKPTFDWNDVTGDLSGISSYNIRVNNTPNFSNLEIDTDRGTSSYASDVSLGEGNQYWWVRATDGAGNQGGDSSRGDFQINLNQPPNASFNCSPGNCTVFNTETLTFNNNSTDPDGSSDITRSEWDILNYGTAPDATCTSPNALCNHTLQQISPNDYTMQLRVVDNAGVSDTDTKSFTVKRDIVAGFMCSLDNVNFVACFSLSGQISQEEVLYLKDSSSLSEYTVVSQGASSVTNRTWKINGSTFGGNSSNPSTAIPTQGTITLELTAQDNQGRSNTQTHTLNPQVPFPEFQEISPF